MKIVVTGSNGFLGSHLISYLRMGKNELCTFDRRLHSLFEITSMEKLLNSADYVIHLAGVNKDGNKSEMKKVNVLGTKSLMLAAEKFAPNATVVFASTFLTYISEDEYGQTKKQAEEIIRNVVRKTSLKAVLLRFSNIYGPGAKPYRNSVIATFVKCIENDEPLEITGGGLQKRDFLHVNDAVAAISNAIDFKPNHVENFDICTGKRTSIIDVVKMMQRYSAQPFEIRLVKFRSTDHAYSLRNNYTKAKKMLEWEPRISLEIGLRDLLEKNV